MKAYHFPSLFLSLLVTGAICSVATGCSKDLAVPKAAADVPAQKPSMVVTEPANLQTASQSPAENPPEKTSPWVTLAGMKCH